MTRNTCIFLNLLFLLYISFICLCFSIILAIWLDLVKKNNFCLEIKSKVKRLLLPYVVFSSIGYIIKWPLSEFSGRPIDFGLYDFLFRLVYPWENPVIFFWFLPTIFIVSIISSLFFLIIKATLDLLAVDEERRNKLNIFSIIVVTSIIVYFTSHLKYRSDDVELFNYTGIMYHLPFFLMGYLMAFFDREKLKNGIMLLLILLLLSYFYTFHDVVRLEALVIILALHLLADTLSKFSPGKAKIAHEGYKFNMSIYLLSFFIQVPIGFVVYQLSNSPMYMIFWSFWGGLLGPILLKLMFNKYQLGRNAIKIIGM